MYKKKCWISNEFVNKTTIMTVSGEDAGVKFLFYFKTILKSTIPPLSTDHKMCHAHQLRFKITGRV